MYRIHGRDPAAGLPSGDGYGALLRPDVWAAWLAHVQKSIQDHSEVDFEYTVDQGGGSAKRVRVAGRPIVGAANQVTEIIGSAIEVSGEAHEKENIGSTTQDPLHQIIDLIPVLAWSCRPDGSADYFNRGWLDYTGLSEN